MLNVCSCFLTLSKRRNAVKVQGLYDIYIFIYMRHEMNDFKSDKFVSFLEINLV